MEMVVDFSILKLNILLKMPKFMSVKDVLAY